MSEDVSVNIDAPSPYIERGDSLYRFRRRLTYKFAFRLLNRYLSRRSNLDILEIGTGSGFFLEFAREFFPSAKFTGLEYDERLLATTRSRAPHARMVQGNAETFDFGDEQFDLIVSFQVIEHLFNPDHMVEKVLKHLKPGGIILLTTPNLTGLGARIMKGNWHGYREDHVCLKGKKEWDQLFSSHGLITLYSGSTFFSGIPILNKFPLGIINWVLLTIFGSLRWSLGESYIGVFKSEQGNLDHAIQRI